MVKGFHIQDDGTRVDMDYGSEQQRAYYECQELLKHKHYAEAYKRLEEYHDYNNRFVERYDMKWILKVEVGYLNVKPIKASFERCAHTWALAVFRSDGEEEEFTSIAKEIIGHFTKAFKIPVQHDVFDDANVKQTIQLLDYVVDYFVVPGAECNTPLDKTQDFLYPVAFGIRHLIAKGEKKKAKDLYKKVATAGFGSFESFMEEQEIEF